MSYCIKNTKKRAETPWNFRSTSVSARPFFTLQSSLFIPSFLIPSRKPSPGESPDDSANLSAAQSEVIDLLCNSPC